MPTTASFDSPFRINFSFSPYLNMLKSDAKKDNFIYNEIIKEVEKRPELDGVLNEDFLYNNTELIKFILSPIFPDYLSENEIKAVNMPLTHYFFNPTKRLSQIITDAGSGFDLQFRNYVNDQFYIMSCCIILNQYYHVDINIDFNLIFDIPNKEGYLNHYRILTNAEFIEIKTTENTLELTEQDIKQLLDNYDDLNLWKEKFPAESWELYGFVIINMYDSTKEVAISNLKGFLIQTKENPLHIKEKFTEIFKSIFRISDLELGFTAINQKENNFEYSPINSAIQSKILFNYKKNIKDHIDPDGVFINMITSKKYFCISDMSVFLKNNPDCYMLSNLLSQNIKSAIFIPIYNDQNLLGIIEIISTNNTLNSIKATAMDTVLPFLSDSMNMMFANMENHILAIIQQEYTTIHPSVYWKFYEEVKKHINIGSNKIIKNLPYKNINFKNLTPLYGQSDVKSSSQKRNAAIVNDLKQQLDVLKKIISSLTSQSDLSELISLISSKENELDFGLKAYTESEFIAFLKTKIYPKLNELKFENIKNNKKITTYFTNLGDNENLIFNSNRSHYENSISVINKEICDLLDKRYVAQQDRFPFYYERFRTDGVDHDIYIGQSIAPWLSYHPVYLHNLRLVQLRVIIESDILFQSLKKQNNYDLEITSLLLTYSSNLAIRFRMDEKKFDVDGSYNARYEVIKKRIDKAFLKNSDQRLVQPEKIAIVFSQNHELKEYMKYIEILQQEQHLTQETEVVEIENLQGVAGLKAIRVAINYQSKKSFDYRFYNDELSF